MKDRNPIFLALLALIAGLAKVSHAELVSGSAKSKLVSTAEQELSNSRTNAQKSNSSSRPMSTSVIPESSSPSFLVANRPSLKTRPSRPSWFASLGLENQKPQGLLSIDGLSPVDLATLDTKSSVLFQLDWWFLKTPQWSSGLYAETSWSQHAYAVEVTTNRLDSEAVLDVFRTTIGTQLRMSLDTWLPTSMTNPGISYFLGGHLAFGRLIQVQSSEDLSRLNRSLSLNHGDWGPHLGALFANKFLVNLSYSRRWAIGSSYEPSNHAQLSFGMSL